MITVSASAELLPTQFLKLANSDIESKKQKANYIVVKKIKAKNADT
jgi:hypothetical protein